MKIQISALLAKTHSDYGRVIKKELTDFHKYVNSVNGDAKFVNKKEKVV